MTTLIAASLTTDAKRRLGRAVYLLALIRALAHIRPFQLALSIVPPPDGGGLEGPLPADADSASEQEPESQVEALQRQQAPIDCTTVRRVEMFQALQVVIGNGRFHAGPFPLAPNATITDGRLVVYAISGVSRWTLLKFALRLPGGRHVDLEQVPAFTAVQGALMTSPSQRVTVDGEIALRTPLNFSVAPRALRVMVPPSFGE